jgi:predicted dehydrogenase
MDTLRVAVVGTGWIAASHLRELKSAGDVEVVAVCDLDADRAAAFAREGRGARIRDPAF